MLFFSTIIVPSIESVSHKVAELKGVLTEADPAVSLLAKTLRDLCSELSLSEYPPIKTLRQGEIRDVTKRMISVTAALMEIGTNPPIDRADVEPLTVNTSVCYKGIEACTRLSLSDETRKCIADSYGGTLPESLNQENARVCIASGRFFFSEACLIGLTLDPVLCVLFSWECRECPLRNRRVVLSTIC